MTETEVKIAVRDLGTAEESIRGLSFEPLGVPLLERNTLYDTAGRTLLNAGKLLRVREAGGAALLTVKAPAGEGGAYKVREEHETAVTDPAELHRILEALGYRPSWRYEKRRTTFRKSGEDGHIDLDDTPVGAFLELEGDAEWIDRTAAALGFSAADYSTASYYDLFVEWKRRTGATAEHMVFT